MDNDLSGNNQEDANCESGVLDSRMKSLLLDLQRFWLQHYETSREKALIDLTTKARIEYSH
jgi:hypothetical protein